MYKIFLILEAIVVPLLILYAVMNEYFQNKLSPKAFMILWHTTNIISILFIVANIIWVWRR